MEKKGMLEDEQTFLWIKQRVSDLSQVMGTADPCPSLFNLLLYQGGLELLEQDAALMPQRLVALKEMLPGTDIVRIVSCVSGSSCHANISLGLSSYGILFGRLQTKILAALQFSLKGVLALQMCMQVPRLLYNSYAVASVQNAVNKLVAIYPYQ